MQTISLQDTMMIRATSMGRLVASFNCSGFSDLDSVLRETCSRISGTRGMVELSLRNRTRGWTSRRALYI